MITIELVLYIVTLIIALSSWLGMIYFSCGMGAILSAILLLIYIPACLLNTVILTLVMKKYKPNTPITKYVIISLIAFALLLYIAISLPLCFVRDIGLY